MEWPNVWAPWRIDYLKGVDAGGVDGDAASGGCFLCDACARPDEDAARLVVHRDDIGVIMLNRYPYTNGHLMVTPARHVGDLPDLSRDDRAALMELTTLAERLIHVVLNPQGINIGVNVGRAAGAGVPGHLHVHLVPRWGGDTNFMNVVGGVRVSPQALDDVYSEMTRALPKVLEMDR
ncbi:MAG: HIT domain-containing protein [Phycisphaera sp.]|nr:HIT domain-containing protein [Phycisphaera sp.]